MGNQFTTNSESDDTLEEENKNWKNIFSRCFRRQKLAKLGFFDLDEYDYVIEKLAIKYVRVSMFATSYDSYEYIRNDKNNQQSQNKSSVLSASVQVSPIQPMNSPKSENLPKTTRKLRFSKQDIGGKSDSVKKPSLAHSIGGTSPAAELMSSLTAFNPHLKDSEAPPKDPCSLNITKSQRSFAEELSEAAARRNISNTPAEVTALSLSVTPGTSKQL